MITQGSIAKSPDPLSVLGTSTESLELDIKNQEEQHLTGQAAAHGPGSRSSPGEPHYVASLIPAPSRQPN